jgi:type VI protein secretion system component VasF
MYDFEKSWREAAALAASLQEKVRQIEEEQSDLDVKRELARWLSRFEALAAELGVLREEANRGGG